MATLRHWNPRDLPAISSSRCPFFVNSVGMALSPRRLPVFGKPACLENRRDVACSHTFAPAFGLAYERLTLAELRSELALRQASLLASRTEPLGHGAPHEGKRLDAALWHDPNLLQVLGARDDDVVSTGDRQRSG